LAPYNLLGDGEQVEGAARQAVKAGHGHHLAGRDGVQHFEELAAVVVRACHLLAINLRSACTAQLLKLGVERLPVGADAGIAETAVLRVSLGHILGEALDRGGVTKFP
jgi:hypothetical protein